MTGFSESFVKKILLTGRAGQRLLNESRVQTNVWVRYAATPVAPVELLITPQDDVAAAQVARRIYADLVLETDHASTQMALRGAMLGDTRRPSPRITPIEGVVAAEFDFMDFLGIVLPKTGFDLRRALEDLLTLLAAEAIPNGQIVAPEPSMGDMLALFVRRGPLLSPRLREALLVALIAATAGSDSLARADTPDRPLALDRVLPPMPDDQWLRLVLAPEHAALPVPVAQLMQTAQPEQEPLIRRVSTNRDVELAGLSVETIKADAAQRVFDISCGAVTWAIIDSGIDGAHPAFRDHAADDGSSRIDKAYDFTQLRNLTAYDRILALDDEQRLVDEVAQRLQIGRGEARHWLGRLREDALEGRPFDWALLSRLIEVAPDKPPASARQGTIGHGTHVAGVLGADWREDAVTLMRGVCPDIRLYDLRVLGHDYADTEFAVIAALEFIRWVNGRNRFITIHGANLSLGLRHELDQHACGRTPVCLACEATVNAGVVVVAAAGNWGAENHETLDGARYSGYATVSIADPGNAASVITVGSTHRERPHEYGVSYFSSRGPTGDGRAKPDVVAPGEQIDGPLPNLGIGRLDGTSMAAPHVSGVAALLMARHPEMAGDPRRIKSVIMNTATDLGREKAFQGAGLVDALRALQAV